MAVSAVAEVTIVILGLLDDVVLVLAGPLDDFAPSFPGGFGAFTHPVRRTVSSRLADDEVLNRTELAEAAAADEAVPHDSVERLETVPHHNHLPKLGDYQYVEYDARSGDVVLRDDPEFVKSQLNSE